MKGNFRNFNFETILIVLKLENPLFKSIRSFLYKTMSVSRTGRKSIERKLTFHGTVLLAHFVFYRFFLISWFLSLFLSSSWFLVWKTLAGRSLFIHLLPLVNGAGLGTPRIRNSIVTARRHCHFISIIATLETFHSDEEGQACFDPWNFVANRSLRNVFIIHPTRW